MAFNRATSAGFLTIKLAASTGGTGTVSPWFNIPAIVANKIHVTATFVGTTGTMKLEGQLSSASTARTVLATRTQAQRSAVIASTIATAVNRVRAMSTKLTGGSGTLYVAFVT